MEVRDTTTRGSKLPNPKDIEAAAKAIGDQIAKVDPNEAQFVGFQFGKDEVYPIIRRNGKDEVMKYAAEAWKGFPEGWKDKYKKSLDSLIAATEEVVALKNREIPLLRDEFFSMGFDKKDLRFLAFFGLAKCVDIKVIDKKTNSKKAAYTKAVVYLTPQGQAYRRDVYHGGKKNVQTDASQSPA